MDGKDEFNNEQESESDNGSDEENTSNEADKYSLLNGRQAGEANVKRLETYIKTLRESGEHLPCRNSKLDKSAIALACGFNRQTLYNNPAAIALLEGAVDLLDEAGKETGDARGTEPVVDGKTAHLKRQMDKRDRRIQTLEVKVQTLTAERDAFKKELAVKDERLRQYEIIEEVMMISGRKFRP